MMGYDIADFEKEVGAVKPRMFDTYLLAPFMIWFALSAKKPMNRWPRRILFTSGIYMMYRNWHAYKTALPDLQATVTALQEGTVPV